MKIDHIAIWTKNLEDLKEFYEVYFGAESGEKYSNAKKQFESYFLHFSGGARLELMQVPGTIKNNKNADLQYLGYAHIAISVGSIDRVDRITARLREDGYEVIGEPRRTGDGYYESVILDPDQNLVEITA